ncbi:hypothetical protein [Streptomyces sp. Y1]|uniref:Uncharacterized protein n=1 Tax=Streptomyces sp. Y1 TaxID=3238634 RepID=A0AB39TVM4_9ACTN
MNPSFSMRGDIEQEAAVALRSTAAVAHALADLAVDDDRYDQLAALAAASYATEAAMYLPLPDDEVPEVGVDEAGQALIDRLKAIADELDELARCSPDIRQMRDLHMVALHTRDAAVALRNALPTELGKTG